MRSRGKIKMDLHAINARLSERRQFYLDMAVTQIETEIKVGIVPNATFNGAKETINRAIEEAAEAFLQLGPHEAKNRQSDWWLSAYNADAFVRGAHGVPFALKRAEKAKDLIEYATFIRVALLPLSELLATAKPLIVKKQNLPKVKTARELEREAKTMTCQCCGMKYRANTGLIAHHGYERPGNGWQTASCFGARHLPFEVSRDRLGEMIEHLKTFRRGLRLSLTEAEKEMYPLPLEYPDYSVKADRFGKRPVIAFHVTRKNFDNKKIEHAEGFRRSIKHKTFDSVKFNDIEHRKAQIKSVTRDINASQKRYDNWTQTHTGFDKKSETWRVK